MDENKKAINRRLLESIADVTAEIEKCEHAKGIVLNPIFPDDYLVRANISELVIVLETLEKIKVYQKRIGW